MPTCRATSLCRSLIGRASRPEAAFSGSERLWVCSLYVHIYMAYPVSPARPARILLRISVRAGRAETLRVEANTAIAS